MTATAEIVPAVPEEARKEITAMEVLPTRLDALVIASHADYTEAATTLKQIKARGKELEKVRKQITKPLDDAKAHTMALFRPASDAVAKAEKIIKQKMLAFDQEQERKRREAEAAAAEKARKEQERLMQRAQAAAQKGQEEKAAALEERAITTVPDLPANDAPLAEGISTRTVWKCRITSKAQLIKAVAEGKASPELLTVNEKVAGELARSLKDTMNIPGLESFADKTMAVR